MAKAAKNAHKTVDHYTFADGCEFTTGCVDYLSVRLVPASESFLVQLVCQLPHDRSPRLLAERLVMFGSRQEMLDAYEAA